MVYYHSVIASPNHELVIDAPSTATEGEEVYVTVRFDDTPIQARIILDDGYPPLYTNASTGGIILIMPSVPSPGRWVSVNASYLGVYHATHYIYVKNKTRLLTVTSSKESVIERDQFIVTVMSNDEPVRDAYVYFDGTVYTTGMDGRVTLTAPDVLVTTTYGIIVNKTGYSTVTSMITVYDADIGYRLMEVTAPLFINDTDKYITVRVYDKNGGLPDTDVYLLYDGEEYIHVKTNTYGIARLVVPTIDKKNSLFYLKVEKDGYRTYSDSYMFPVYILGSDNNCSLRLEVSTDEANSGSLLTLKITDEYGKGVKDARIWRSDGVEAGCTDPDGLARVVIPYVFYDREIILYGVKHGCNFASKTIKIKASVGTYPGLCIITDDTMINEGEVFRLRVTDRDDNPIDNATVIFNMLERQSDKNGEVYLTAPDVDEDAFYIISVFKDGYQPGSVFIMIVNTSSNDLRLLFLDTPSYIWEGRDFVVIVKDRYGYPVEDARVSFHGIDRLTDDKGMVVLTAPNVALDTLLKINVEKNRYTPVSVDILIRARVNYPYHYIILIVAIIILIGVIYHMRYNR